MNAMRRQKGRTPRCAGPAPRGFIIVASAAALAAAAALLSGGGSLAAAGASAASPRPNILVVEVDDQEQESMRVMQHVNADIAAQAVTFKNSFVNFSLCCPSRATF